MKANKIHFMTGMLMCLGSIISSCSHRNIFIIEDYIKPGKDITYKLFHYLEFNTHDNIVGYKQSPPLIWDTINNNIIIKGELDKYNGAIHVTEYWIPRFGNPGVINIDSLLHGTEKDEDYKSLRLLNDEECQRIKDTRYYSYINEEITNPVKHKFELLCGKDIYGKFTKDSVGIFNSLKKEHARHRTVDEISGNTILMMPNDKLYDFRYRWPLTSAELKTDYTLPVWCRGTLPGEFRKLAMPTYNDFIWDFGDNQYVWMHLDREGKEIGLSRPEEMTKAQTDSIIDKFFIEDFPAQLMNMSKVKKRLLNAKPEESIRLHTNRVYIISTNIRREKLPLFKVLYKEAFVEEDFATLENILKFIMAGKDFWAKRELKPNELMFETFLYDYLSIPEEMEDSIDLDDFIWAIFDLTHIVQKSDLYERTIIENDWPYTSMSPRP